MHQGPLVLDHAQTVVGEEGAIVRGGIRITADDVTPDLTVQGGEYGIEVREAESVEIDDVVIESAALDGINARQSELAIRGCEIRSLPGAADTGHRHLVRVATAAEPRRGLPRRRRQRGDRLAHGQCHGARQPRPLDRAPRDRGDGDVDGPRRGQPRRGRARGRDLLRRLLALLDRGQPRLGDAGRPSGNPTRAGFGLVAHYGAVATVAATRSSAHRHPSSVPGSNLADLRRASVETILAGQAPSGGYVASPTFPPYGFSWLRDGSFIADAMSRVGEVESAEAFFGWVAGSSRAGSLRGPLHLEGERDESEWPHRQHDGWGSSWALREHAARHGGGAAGARRPPRRPRTWNACAGAMSTGGRSARASMPRRRVHRGRARRRARPDPRRGAARREPPRPPLPRLRPGRRLAPRQPRRRRPPPPRRRLLRRRRVAAADGAARARGAGSRRRAARMDRGPRRARRLLPEQSQDHLLHPRSYDEWVARWGRRPRRSSGRTRCSSTLDHELGAG